MSVLIQTKDAVLWVQPKGPGPLNSVDVTSCTSLGDITIPKGDLTAVYCNSNTDRGSYSLAYTTKAPPDLVTTQATIRMANTEAFLNNLCDDANLFVLASKCANPELFDIDESAVLVQLQRVAVTSETIGALVNLGEDAEVIQTFDITARDLQASLHRYLTFTRITTAEVTKANDISIVDDACANACSAKVDALEIYYTAQDAVSLATANVLFRDKNNTTPIATSADPFAADENISGIEVFSIAVNTLRIVVAAGTTDAAAPAKIAYADVDVTDPGTTVWTTVSIGTVNAEFVPRGGGLVAMNDGTLYAVTDAGNIHKSINKGITWTTQTSGTTAVLNVITPAQTRIGLSNKNVLLAAGATNIIRKTVDAGVTWQTIVGDSGQAAANILSAHIFSSQEFWVGYDDGKIFVTKDGGKTWTESTLPKNGMLNLVVKNFSTVDRINDIHFIDESVGFVSGMVTDAAADEFGAVWKTVDGGFSWKLHNTGVTYSAGSPEGVTAVGVNNNNTVLAVGDLITTTSIHKLVGPV